MERNSYPTTTIYGVYVPVVPSYLAKGTAFAGREVEGDRVLLYYEEPGNYANVVTFEDRLHHAADRMHTAYPTSKMMGLPKGDLIKVAETSWEPDMGWIIKTILDGDELREWDQGPHHEGGSPERRATRDGKQAMRKLGLAR